MCRLGQPLDGDDGVVVFTQDLLDVRHRSGEAAGRLAERGLARFGGVAALLGADPDRVQSLVGRVVTELGNRAAVAASSAGAPPSRALHLQLRTRHP